MAQPTMAAVPGLKETYIQLKSRMDKAMILQSAGGTRAVARLAYAG